MTVRYLEALSRQINGLLVMNRLAKERLDRLERGQAQLEQAILEIAATLRRSELDGFGALSLRPSDSDRQNADASSTLST